MPVPTLPADVTEARSHLLQVWLVGLILVLATYFVADAQSLRPGRVLGALGIEGLHLPFNSANPPETADSARSEPGVAGDPSRAGIPLPGKDAGEVSNASPRQQARPPEAATESSFAARRDQPASAPDLPERAGVLRPIEGGQHLGAFFRSLDRSSTELTRVLHYGDSTLAGDGIAKTVRSRLKQRFGDGGAGFFVAGMDARWMRRDDLRIGRDGDWEVHTILFGGNQGRYGLGGVSARPRGLGVVHAVANRKGGTLGRRIEVYTNLARSESPIRLQINGQTIDGMQRNRLERFEHWSINPDEDVTSIKLSVLESGLEVYGIVSEFAQGLTWETTAVVGIASGSLRQFNGEHLAAQTRMRDPHLIVLMLGGNETTHGGLASADGRIYRESYLNALSMLRRGAPGAACLVMAPLDQAFQAEDGRVRSKPVMSKMVQVQRDAANEAGCAFWDSWSFMGGNGAFSRWLAQGMAWTDLVHLTDKGLTRVGDALADALLAEYEHWRGVSAPHRSGPNR